WKQSSPTRPTSCPRPVPGLGPRPARGACRSRTSPAGSRRPRRSWPTARPGRRCSATSPRTACCPLTSGPGADACSAWTTSS
ncbi:MAG: hypothetical protein AVDCRST_MAG75-1959, partial [uncultured Propionibacteriaceae bacterium]